MRIAFFADIHANLPAFEAALADARSRGATHLICLGDLVGYGPQPAETVERVRAVSNGTLMGNHDAATVGLISSWNFRPEAKAGFLRHGIELGAEALSWLRGLPHVYRGELFAAAHGSLVNPEAFAYILREGDALAAFEAMDATPLLFVGHTHLSLAVERTGRSRVRVRDADRL